MERYKREVEQTGHLSRGSFGDLISEVERLRVDCECHRIQAVDRGNSYQNVAVERDRYKAALERIADLDCLCYGSNDGCNCPACTAAEAVRP